MNDASAARAAIAAEPKVASTSKRLRRMLFVLLVAGLVAVGVGIYWYLFERGTVSTDNAYVAGNVVQVTPLVGGTVTAIYADDTKLVDQGQVLVQLDPADAEADLKSAEAALGDAVRSVRELYANENVARSAVDVRRADVERARAEVNRAKAEESRLRAEYERRKQLVEQGFVSGENAQNAKSALDAGIAQRLAAESAVTEASASMNQARRQLESRQVLIDATDVAGHPRVQEAAGKVREAFLALARTKVLAPISGYVAKRSVQLGQHVAMGTPLMSIISATDMWVDANFKESQLADVRIGQPATLTADLYGSKVVYRGHVAGLSSGTGAAFSLLPPQNATGNWIKIVQRVPVRIELDAGELKQHPLRIGLSMRADVDTRDRSGAVLATQAQTKAVYATDVYAGQSKQADALIASIISANQGSSRE